jgi:hypothetical protein
MLYKDTPVMARRSDQNVPEPIRNHFIAKSYSLLHVDINESSGVQLKPLLRQIKDLTLSLKIEKRDHILTKEELENVRQQYESLHGDLNVDF